MGDSAGLPALLTCRTNDVRIAYDGALSDLITKKPIPGSVALFTKGPLFPSLQPVLRQGKTDMLSNYCAARTCHRHKTSDRPRGFPNRIRHLLECVFIAQRSEFAREASGLSDSRPVLFIPDAEIKARIDLPGDLESAMMVRYPG
jgi:hypothetical protein